MDPISAIAGAVGALGNLTGLADPVVKTASEAAGGLLAGGGAAALDPVGGALTTQQFVALAAASFAGSAHKGAALGAVWKANIKKLTPDDYARLAELGVVANAQSPTLGDKQAAALLVLQLTASSKPFKLAFETWLTAQDATHIGSPGNLDLFREWGVVS